MDSTVPEEKLSSIIKDLANEVDCYYWRLTGDDHNSICRFLGMTEQEMKSLLRLCGAYSGPKDTFNYNSFETFFKTLCGLDWSHYKHKSWPKGDYFIKIGKGNDINKPKQLYDDSGVLHTYPQDDKHVLKKNRTQRAPLMKLIGLAKAKPIEKPKQPTKRVRELSPRESLNAFIRDQRDDAIKNGSNAIPTASSRRLKGILQSIVEQDMKVLMKNLIDKMEKMAGGDIDTEVNKEAATPDVHASGGDSIITPLAVSDLTQDINAEYELDGGHAQDDSVDSANQGSPTTDDFTQQLKEDVLLQSLLHKRIHDKKERVFHLEHRNGRRLCVAVPPDTKSPQTFLEEAKKTKWTEALLDTPEKKEGMLLFLAKNSPDLYSKVAKKKKIKFDSVVLTTAQTLALARVANLNDTRLNAVKSFLRNIGEVTINHKKKEIERIDKQVGLNHTKKDVQFDTTVFEWSRTEGKEKKQPEKVSYWNSSLKREIEAEIDLHLCHRYRTTDANEATLEPPDISYKGDGFENEGVTILIGGDHGDKNCPISAKLNLASPKLRKEIKDLNCQCPIIQFASIECSKDAFELMDETVMPAMRKQINDMRESAIVTIYHRKNVRSCYRSYTTPRTIKKNTISFHSDNGKTVMSYAYGDDGTSHGSLLLEDDVFRDVPFFELGGKVVVSQFNDLYVGDLAFLAMLIGMNNSEVAHCLLCRSGKSDFNVDASSPENLKPKRTIESLTYCLEQYILEVSKGNKNKPANCEGVNCKGLVDIDPQRILVPILHCPMGLIDKPLEWFQGWVNLEVESLAHDTEKESIRLAYKLSLSAQESAEKRHQEAIDVSNASPDNQQLKTLVNEMDDARKKAVKHKQKQKKACDEAIKLHNAKKASLKQKFESVFRKNGVKRDHYHGGKFNGVNCTRIMGKAEDLFLGSDGKGGFLEHCLDNRAATIDEATIKSRINDCCDLLGCLDSIWSKVRGVDSGPLPTEDQIEQLEKAIAAGKKKWVQHLKITTYQPKWHLTFDGHLVEQVRRFQGLADKSDESIEKCHQALKELRGRFRSVPSYEMKETCMRRELRRKRSPDIEKEVKRYEKKKQQSAGTKRSLDAQARQQEAKRVKTESRDAAVSRSSS